jgi:hypothetical protein
MTVRTAPERHFPDDQEVDQWIADHFLDEAQMANPSPVVDQLQAAAAEVDARFRGAAPGLVASGKIRMAFLDIPDSDRTKFRGVVRQVMAAEGAVTVPLCPHTRLVRPMLLVCDPPVAICADCVRHDRGVGGRGFEETVAALGHFWNYQCDRCGARVERLTATTIGLGFIMVSGHLCSSCAADDQHFAERRADRVVIVPPRPQKARRQPRSKRRR